LIRAVVTETVTNVNGNVTIIFIVMAGLVPAIPITMATPCHWNRDRRNKSGDDE
jgi:hypothetical protein